MASIYKQKTSRYWWVKYAHPEKGLVRKSLRTTDKSVAKAHLKKYLGIERGQRPVDADLTSLVEQWHGYNCMTGSASQGRRNLANLKVFIADSAITMPEQITTGAVQQWVVRLSAGSTPATVKNKLAAVTNFCRFLVEREILASCPSAKTPTIRRRPPRFLNPQQIAQVFQLAENIGDTCYLGVLIALKTGLRMDEIRKLEWQDFQWDQKLVVIPITKSNRPRSVPLHPELLTALQQHVRDDGPVFPSPLDPSGPCSNTSFRRMLRPIQDAMPEAFTEGQSKCSTGRGWHLLRHTFASRYVQAGGDIYRLSSILGHTNIAMTQRYAHLAPAAHDPILEAI